MAGWRDAALPVSATAAAFAALAHWLPGQLDRERLPAVVFEQVPQTPEVSLALSQTQAGHWAVEIGTTGFVFSDLCGPDASAAVTGHAHVYLDGRKAGRATVPAFDLGRVPPGPHRLRVELRSAAHKLIASRDGTAHATLEFDVPAP